MHKLIFLILWLVWTIFGIIAMMAHDPQDESIGAMFLVWVVGFVGGSIYVFSLLVEVVR